MAGPLADFIVTNPAANTWYNASQGYGIVANSGTSYTNEVRTFNSSGTQTVYGNIAVGVHDQTTSTDSHSGWYNSAFGATNTFSLGNNGSDILCPSGEVSVNFSGGAYMAIRVNSFTGRQAINVKVRRSGVWQYITASKVRRSGAWNNTTGIKVRRSGAWSVIG